MHSKSTNDSLLCRRTYLSGVKGLIGLLPRLGKFPTAKHTLEDIVTWELLVKEQVLRDWYAEIWLSGAGEGIDSIMEGMVRVEKNDIYSFTKQAIEAAAVMYEHHEEFDKVLRISSNMNPKRQSDQRPPTDIDEDVYEARKLIRVIKPFSNLARTELFTLTNKKIDTSVLKNTSVVKEGLLQYAGVEIDFEKLAEEGLDDLVKHARSEYTSKLLKKILLKPMKQRKSKVIASPTAGGSMERDVEDDGSEDDEKEENN